jgi:hypothetical protein
MRLKPFNRYKKIADGIPGDLLWSSIIGIPSGAKVEPADFREYGLAEVKILKAEGVFKAWGQRKPFG